MTRLRDIHGPGHSQLDYLRACRRPRNRLVGRTRHPSPWPDDFLDPNSGWRCYRGSHPDHELPNLLQNGDEPPF